MSPTELRDTNDFDPPTFFREREFRQVAEDAGNQRPA
jgi:hypothetical protein